MKKKIILLLIVLVGMVVFTPNANAAANGTVVSHGGAINSGIHYSGEGSFNSHGRGEYQLHNLWMKIGDKEYKAWCVDPHLKARRGFQYTCSPLKDPGLEYIFNNKTGDEATDATAFRFYAIYAGIGMEVQDESGNTIQHGSLNYEKAALIRYLQVRNSPGTLPGYESSVPSDFLWGNEEAIERAYQIATTAAQMRSAQELEEATTGETGGLKYTISTYDPMSVTYVVTSSFPMKQEELEFTCENCAGGKPDIISWSEFSVTLKVNQLSSEGDGCKFIINAKFKKNGMYGCYSGEGRQFQVIMIEDPTEANFPFEGQNPRCGGPECCEENPIKEPFEGQISNCCEESTHSYVAEPDLDELFCYHDGLQVPYYWEKCGGDAYKVEEINEYCDLYCTERVTIDVPGAIAAKSGRYFTLSPNPVGHTTSPYIEGFKRCRVRVKYDLWEKHYVEAVRDEVKKYNAFQLAAANYHFYVQGGQGGYLGSEVVSGTVDLSQACRHWGTCTGSKPCSTPGCKGSVSYTYGCWKDDADVTGTYAYTYTKYSFKTSLPYQTSKTKEDPVTHKEIEVLKDSIKNASHDPYTVWDRTTEQSKAQAAGNALTCPSGQSENGSPSVGQLPDGGVLNENFDSQKSSLKGIMDGAAAAYSAAVTTAKNLEEKLTLCDTYFETKSAQEMYEFNPVASFTYTQLYRKEDGSSKDAIIEIGYKDTPGCQIIGPEKGSLTYEGGMDTAEPRYSGVYLTGFFNGKDFDGGTIEYDNDGSKFPGEKDPAPYKADKLFMHDARYKAICEWEEDPNQVHTLVPNGVVSESAETNFTRHEYEYKVFLTTYDGTFETDWSVANIGENNKFDQYILDHGGNTCAGNAPSTNKTFSCTLHVEYEIVYVGKCNGVTVNPDDCDPVKNVEGLFQFKVADPSNIFPTGTTTDSGAEFAKNWTKTSEGQSVKAEIEQTGKRGLTYSPERESYKFHLTPEIMRHIKNYNVTRNSGNIGGYSDFNMTCDCPDYVQTNTLQGGGVGCTKCRSNLLSDLANNSISYEGQSYTVRTWSSDKSIDQVRNESHWR